METFDARRALLARLIDHAPMFPPASLSAEDALAEDVRAAESPNAFLLGRLVWPASAAASLPAGRPISLVLDAAPPSGLEPEAVEAPYREELNELELAPEVYVEVPVDDAFEGRLGALARRGLHAKVRCGGAGVPSSAELAGFVTSCRTHGLAFKATAGLHHALRGNGEHGFLNLLAAAAFPGEEEAALDEDDPAAFVLTADRLAWRDCSASAADLARMRTEVLHSIGSCSFFEPIEELESLGVLPL